MRFQSDHVASDDLAAVLELSFSEHSMSGSPSTHPSSYSSQKRLLLEKLAEHEADIAKYTEEIQTMQLLVNYSKGERDKLLKELNALRPAYAGKGKARQKDGIDYAQDKFEWIGGLKAKMQEVFNIASFRLCQEGACNANMDGRDIVCVMATGGGKSLTYQLPALLQPGCTLVISPLLSLIDDQIIHLTDYGVQAVKLTRATSQAQSTHIASRLHDMAAGKVRSSDEIKLCYVTPEKIAKSKTFLSTLQKLANARRLARIVIDEAHCLSQLGHDFRPDYQQLHILRKLFPHVPIMALSATCPPNVLQDLLKTLGLKPVVDGNNAAPQGTVYFTAPLYRKNLHYSIVPKPSKTADVVSAMKDYILKHHAGDSGIIYCLSKKDCELVADRLQQLSGGAIKTGVYHSERSELDKEQLHVAWRKGTINVVCATIAFGLGIDKGDVRFVLHHSLSKSLEGFYQESGRAGRDGKDSHCVLYYRPQDGTTLSTMVSKDKDGKSKLHAMLKFAQDLTECRKTQFAKYFSHSTQLAMSSWSTADADVLSPCGHCDNCTRAPDAVEVRDVTLHAWQLLRIVEALEKDGARVTLNMLAGLARGKGGGTYEAKRGGSGKGGRWRSTKEKQTLDLDAVAGGEVRLTKDEIERLLVDLLLQQYLEERYQATSFTTNVYLVRGPRAPRLLAHRTQGSLAGALNLKVECAFLKHSKKTTKAKSASASASPRKPAKRPRVESDDDDGEREDIIIEMDMDGVGDDEEEEEEEEEETILKLKAGPGPSTPRPAPAPNPPKTIKAAAAAAAAKPPPPPPPSSSRTPAGASRKRKWVQVQVEVSDSDSDDDDDDAERENIEMGDVEDVVLPDDRDGEGGGTGTVPVPKAKVGPPRPRPRPRPGLPVFNEESNDDDDVMDDWECFIRGRKGPRAAAAKPRSSGPSPAGRYVGRAVMERDRTVYVLSD